MCVLVWQAYYYLDFFLKINNSRQEATAAADHTRISYKTLIFMKKE